MGAEPCWRLPRTFGEPAGVIAGAMGCSRQESTVGSPRTSPPRTTWGQRRPNPGSFRVRRDPSPTADEAWHNSPGADVIPWESSRPRARPWAVGSLTRKSIRRTQGLFRSPARRLLSCPRRPTRNTSIKAGKRSRYGMRGGKKRKNNPSVIPDLGRADLREANLNWTKVAEAGSTSQPLLPWRSSLARRMAWMRWWKLLDRGACKLRCEAIAREPATL